MTCWVGHLMPLSINPCVLTEGSNNTHGYAESWRPAARTSPYCVTQRGGSIGWLLWNEPQTSGQVAHPRHLPLTSKRCFLPHFKYKLWLRFFFYAHFSNINVPAIVSSQQRHCIWLNCEGGRSIITLLPPPGWSVVMTKGCGGSKHRTKAPSSWLPTETGSKTA